MDYPARRRERLARLLPDEGLDAFLTKRKPQWTGK